MSYRVRTDSFEGPFDLLLYLVSRQKVDIGAINITQIADQYLAEVGRMQNLDLDVASDFLLVASTLLEIKAQSLLPREHIEVEDDIAELAPSEARDMLVERLLEYRKYKYMSGELRDMSVGSDHIIYKEPSIPKEVAHYRPPVDVEALLQGVTMTRLRAVFEDVLKRQAQMMDPVRSQFGRIEKETVQISDRIGYVRKKVLSGGRHSFRSLLREGATKTEIVVTFLAILELIKTGDILFTEDSTRDDFILEGNG